MAESQASSSTSEESLRSAAAVVPQKLQTVLDRIVRATAECKSVRGDAPDPRLVAVSKTKPADLVIAAYRAGQRHFGENYVKEFVEKSNAERVVSDAPDIKWHFIGHLQRNKCKQLLGARGLWVVETVDSERLATALDSACQSSGRQEPLRVLVQLNTSGEDNKHGCSREDLLPLVRHVREACSHLTFCGLMTIGALAQSLQNSTGNPNSDFEVLTACRTEVCQVIEVEPSALDLSMGMTNDMEQAIRLGSTNVRVGTAIFGARDYT